MSAKYQLNLKEAGFYYSNSILTFNMLLDTVCGSQLSSRKYGNKDLGGTTQEDDTSPA